MPARQARHLDRFMLLAVAAAELALDHRGGAPDVDPVRAGVHLGRGMGGLGTLETQVGVLAGRGAGRVSPFTLPMTMPDAAVATVSMRHGFRGPSEARATACAAGRRSVVTGARMVADGRRDVVLAGAAESCPTPTTLAALTVMTALSGSGCSRPSDVARDGSCLSKEAAVLVLEEREAARARGARLYSEMLAAPPATPTT
jgi:3-oxoacyl-[acyl-carrier-protein] synthase II